MSEVIEAAFSYGEHEHGWYAKITFKCGTCGRRNRQVLQGTEPQMPLPLVVTCKFGHTTLVKPYDHLEKKH